MKKFSHILAMDEKNWIGKNNDLAWRIPADMKYFKKMTASTKDFSKRNAVIMWRKTWESIPEKYRPLPYRINCVLSRSIKDESTDSKKGDMVLYFNSVESCLEELEKKEDVEQIFILGGANIYNQLLDHPRLEKIYLTQVFWDYDCDVFFDGVPDSFVLSERTERNTENEIEFEWQVYKKK